MDHFIATITSAPIFIGLSREDLARVAGKLDEITVAAGTTVIRQGDPGDALYIVRAGAVEILNAGDRGEAERIAILGPRECFGEIAIFTGARRTANVVAVIDTSLLRLSKEACEDLVTQCPGFSLHICRLLGQRLVERGRELARSQVSRDAVLSEFLAAQTLETRTLLQRASVLKTITPGAFAVLLDETPDLDTLARLAESYPRLVEADGHGGFTLHVGLRAFLIAQLTPVESQTLHRRVAAHFESIEDWDRAIDHHLDAGDWADAVRVLEQWGDGLLERESTPRLLARIDTLPLVTGRSRFHLLRLRVKAHAIRDELEPALHGCRELLAPAHGPSLGAVASAFAYQVRLAELHRDRGKSGDALRSLRDALAVLEPGQVRGQVAPAEQRSSGRPRRGGHCPCGGSTRCPPWPSA